MRRLGGCVGRSRRKEKTPTRQACRRLSNRTRLGGFVMRIDPLGEVAGPLVLTRSLRVANSLVGLVQAAEEARRDSIGACSDGPRKSLPGMIIALVPKFVVRCLDPHVVVQEGH